jgi:hypothetical protein
MNAKISADEPGFMTFSLGSGQNEGPRSVASFLRRFDHDRELVLAGNRQVFGLAGSSSFRRPFYLSPLPGLSDQC